MTGVGTTVIGWTVIAAAAGGLYYLSTKDGKTRRAAPTKQQPRPVENKKEKVKKAKKATGVQSDGDSEAKSGPEKRKTKKPEATKPQPQQPSYAAVADEKDDDVDNHEFARQMAAAKSGAFVAPKAKGETRAKSVKQNKAFDKETVAPSNATSSSANGGDADDEQFPVEAPNHGGVDDMLEKPGSGPSVLKISAPTNPTPAKKPKAQANQEPAETKKQRQNRQKAEAAKLQREQDEAERQKLMEQTRRNARIAEGRAAKDGSSFLTSKGPAHNSWTVPPSSVNGTTTSTQKVELLDTNEPSSEKSIAREDAPTGKQEGGKWNTSLSEEEQIRLLNENDNWETVKKDKKKRTAKEEPKAGNSSADESKDFGVPPKIEPSGPGKKWAATLVHVDDKKNVVEREVDLQDDEWEVS